MFHVHRFDFHSVIKNAFNFNLFNFNLLPCTPSRMSLFAPGPYIVWHARWQFRESVSPLSEDLTGALVIDLDGQLHFGRPYFGPETLISFLAFVEGAELRELSYFGKERRWRGGELVPELEGCEML